MNSYHVDGLRSVGRFFSVRLAIIVFMFVWAFSAAAQDVGASDQSQKLLVCDAGGAPTLKLDDDKIEWQISNLGDEPIVIDSITLSWPQQHEDLNKIKLGGDTIYEEMLPAPMATIDSGWKSANPDKRTIDSGKTEALKLEFDEKFKDADLTHYKITVNFSSGCSVEFDLSEITACTVGAGPVLKVDDNKIEWALFNIGLDTITIESINLTWPLQNGDLEKVELNGKLFDDSRAPPETLIDGNWEGDLKDRQLKAGKNKKLKFKFDNKFEDALPGDYGIQVVFEEGCMEHFNAPFDQLVPEVTLIDPADGNVAAIDSELVFQIIDEPAGVDPDSIVVAVNGVEISSDRFTFDGTLLTISADPNDPWAPGNLQIYIDVADRAGNGSRYTFNLQVLQSTGAFPVAIPSFGVAPLTVTFIPQSTADTVITLYEWDFQGDGIFDRSDVIGTNQTFTFTVPGDYIATMRVTDQTGSQDIGTVLVRVANGLPQVTAEATPSNGSAPLLVNFSATATDNEGIALYEWDFEGDGTFDFSSPTDSTATFTYTQQAVFQPVLRVTDTLGASTTIAVPSIEVRVNPPGSPSVTATASPVTGAVPLFVNFSATAIDPDGLPITEWAWDFENDGTFDVQAATPNASFTYVSAGVFFARVRATASDGGVSEDLIQINVEPVVTLEVSIDTIDPGLMETATVSTTLGGDTDVSIVIEDRNGAVVRVLIPAGVRTAGSYDDVWDGTDDTGAVVSEGDYYAVILITVDGQTERLDLRTSTGGGQYLPGRTSLPNSFAPFAGQPLTFTYVLPRASEVTSFMGRFNVNVRLVTFFQREPMGRGSHTVVWNGENADGQLIHPPPGDAFLLGLFGYFLADNAIYVRSGASVSALAAAPSIFSPGSVAADGGAQMSTLTFNLSKDAAVQLDVFEADTGLKLAELSYPGLVAGPQSLQWDGRTENGVLVAPGRYRLGVKAIDATGFTSLTVFTVQRIFY